MATTACSKGGSLDLSVDTGNIGTDDTSDTADTDTTDTTDTDTDTDTDTTETNVFEEWAGTYTGNLDLYLWGGDWSECSVIHQSSFEISLDGVLEGSGECKGDWSYFPHAFSGEVDESGEVSGVVSITADVGGRGAQIFDFDFSGQIDEGELEIGWIGAADMGNWAIDVRGEVTAD